MMTTTTQTLAETHTDAPHAAERVDAYNRPEPWDRPAELTDEHVQWATRLAWRTVRSFYDFRLDIDDVLSDALFGLSEAYMLYVRALGPFKPFAYLKMRGRIHNGIRAESTRLRILNAVSLSAIVDRQHDEAPHPALSDPALTINDVADIAASNELLLELLRWLRNERPMVVEAVLKTRKDEEIARAYGIGRDTTTKYRAANGTVIEYRAYASSAVTQARKKFLRRFMEAHAD